MSGLGRRLYRVEVCDGSQAWTTVVAARNKKSAERIARIVEAAKWGQPITWAGSAFEDLGYCSPQMLDAFETMQARYGGRDLEAAND